MKNMSKNSLKSLVLSVLILVAATIVIAGFDLDMRLAEWLHTADGGFVHGGQQPWAALYEYGEWPGLLLAVGALGALLLGLVWQPARRYRLASAFLVLLYLIGPGLLVNVTLKEYWGRPRPADIVEFGGTRDFRQPWQIRTVDRRNSFPSGHASVAFYLAAPWFLLRSTRKRAAYGWLSVGVGFGLLVGAARMAQGAHFLSDVLWSGGLVYLTGLVLALGMGLGVDVRRQAAIPAGLALGPPRPRWPGRNKAWTRAEIGVEGGQR